MSSADEIAATRAACLDHFREHAAAIFELMPAVRSVLLGISQIYGEAVQAVIVVSERTLPVWPHGCLTDELEYPDSCGKAPGEGCHRCIPGIGYPVDWASDERKARAFEAWVVSAVGYDLDPDCAALPFAVARSADGAIELELVGTLRFVEHELATQQRGDDRADSMWDDPRALELWQQMCAHPRIPGAPHVLADHLLERGDPRGEYLAAALATPRSARADELLERHRRRWTHPLSRVVPLVSMQFERGVLAAAEVYAGTREDVAAVRGAPAWASVESLRVHRESQCVLDPVMTSLRSVGPLNWRWIITLANAPTPWAIEHLEIECRDLDRLDQFGESGPALLARSSALPNLRSLVLRGTIADDVIPTLRTASWWKQLARVTIAAREPVWGSGVDRRRAVAPVGWFALVHEEDAPVASDGWEVAFGPEDACRITLRGFCSLGSVTRLDQILRDLPRTASIELVPSAHYVPSPTDADRLARIAGRPVFCRE